MSLSGPMTARPSLSIHSRPLSAIYIGPNPPAHHIPDLPEPPSPGSSSNGSGLPSPPATNSTGSGSTTGGNSTNTGSLRQRPVSLPSTNMTNGTSIKTPTTSFTKNGRLDEEEDEHENDDDEDHTAQLGRQQFHRSSSENVLALQRVKSLTQRNRMVSFFHFFVSQLLTQSPLLPWTLGYAFAPRVFIDWPDTCVHLLCVAQRLRFVCPFVFVGVRQTVGISPPCYPFTSSQLPFPSATTCGWLVIGFVFIEIYILPSFIALPRSFPITDTTHSTPP
jgi:hypothetical protein